MKTKLFLLIYLFIGSLSAIEFNHPLTVGELIDVALENHPSTKMAWWNARRAAAAVGSAKSDFYPTIGLEARLLNGRDFKSINGPDVSYTIVGADLFLDMILFDFGGRQANVNAAKKALQAAHWQTSWNIQKVMIGVLQDTYATLHAKEELEATAISLKEAETLFRAASELNRVGLTSIVDVYTSQAMLSDMQMDFAQKKAALDIQKGKLITQLGLSIDTALEVAPIIPQNFPETRLIDELLSKATTQRTDLLAKQARLAESYAVQERTRTLYKPKLYLATRGGANHAFHDKAQAGQYQIALKLDIPLFEGFDSIYQNRMAYADTKLVQEEMIELQLNIALEVLTYHRALIAAEEMRPESEKFLQSSIKAFESSMEKYRAGKERITDVAIMQQQLATARIKYHEVKTQWMLAMANLAYATGTLQPEGQCANIP